MAEDILDYPMSTSAADSASTSSVTTAPVISFGARTTSPSQERPLKWVAPQSRRDGKAISVAPQP